MQPFALDGFSLSAMQICPQVSHISGPLNPNCLAKVNKTAKESHPQQSYMYCTVTAFIFAGDLGRNLWVFHVLHACCHPSTSPIFSCVNHLCWETHWSRWTARSHKAPVFSRATGLGVDECANPGYGQWMWTVRTCKNKPDRSQMAWIRENNMLK